MRGDEPFILLRARVREEQGAFAGWFRSHHLREIRKIPGVTAVFWAETKGHTQLGIYCFQDAQAMQGAFGSPEAAYARGTWARWGSVLEEFSVEMQFPLIPPTMTVSVN